MIHVGLGHADGFDTKRIVSKVLNDCRAQLNGSTPGGGIVFAGPHIDHRLMLEMINENYPGLELVGCTTAGNYSSFDGVGEDAVTLALFASDEISFSAGLGTHFSSNYQKAVAEAHESAQHNLSAPPTLCLTFPNIYGIPFEPALAQLNELLGPDCPTFGGVAGTLWKDTTSIYQFFKNDILTDSLPILLMSGPVEYAFSLANSWRPIGKRALGVSFFFSEDLPLSSFP